MLTTATVTATVGHPAVAALLGLGASALAALVVAMAWNVHVRQLRLAELLARRQIIAPAEEAAEHPAEAAAPAAVNGGGHRSGGGNGNGGGNGGGGGNGNGGGPGTAPSRRPGEPSAPGHRSWSSTARIPWSPASRSATASGRRATGRS